MSSAGWHFGDSGPSEIRGEKVFVLRFHAGTLNPDWAYRPFFAEIFDNEACCSNTVSFGESRFFFEDEYIADAVRNVGQGSQRITARWGQVY